MSPVRQASSIPKHYPSALARLNFHLGQPRSAFIAILSPMVPLEGVDTGERAADR